MCVLELRELEEEIGELSGLDGELVDSTGFGYRPSYTFGSSISASIFPSGVKEQMEFFKEVEASEKAVETKFRGGRAVEQEEFENLLKEVELELAEAASKQRGAAPAVVEMTATTAEVSTTVAAPETVETVSEIVPSESEEPPSESSN